MLEMSRRRCSWVVIASSALLISISLPLRAEQSNRASLTPGEIQEAIEFGKKGKPSPYLLRQRGLEGNPVVIALVYTPFVRVALLSQASAQRHESLTVNDISPDVIEPTLFIAFRWYYCCAPHDPPDPADFNPAAPPDPEVLALARWQKNPLARTAKGVTPSCESHKGRRSVSLYGGFENYNDIVLVAEFPMTLLKTGQSFRIVKRYPDRSSDTRLGVIRASDFARWR